MRWVAAVVAVLVAGLLVLAREQGEAEVDVVPPTTSTTQARPQADLWGMFPGDGAPDGAYERSILRDLGTDEPTTRLRRVLPGDEGRAFLLQNRGADPFRGGAVRFAVDVRTIDAGAVRLFLRVLVNTSEDFAVLAAHEGDPISGTQARTLAVELDVPDEATQLELGVILEGGGEVSVGEWSLEPVGSR